MNVRAKARTLQMRPRPDTRPVDLGLWYPTLAAKAETRRGWGTRLQFEVEIQEPEGSCSLRAKKSNRRSRGSPPRRAATPLAWGPKAAPLGMTRRRRGGSTLGLPSRPSRFRRVAPISRRVFKSWVPPAPRPPRRRNRGVERPVVHPLGQLPTSFAGCTFRFDLYGSAHARPVMPDRFLRPFGAAGLRVTLRPQACAMGLPSFARYAGLARKAGGIG
jgi:hypothetical protein